MGDRANIVITAEPYEGRETPSPIYLYTHWHGYEVEQLLADGLRKAVAAGRLNDEQYRNRLIAESFFTYHTANGEDQTGCGLGTSVGDGDDHLVTLVHVNGKLAVEYSEETDEDRVSRLVPVDVFCANFPAK